MISGVLKTRLMSVLKGSLLPNTLGTYCELTVIMIGVIPGTWQLMGTKSNRP